MKSLSSILASLDRRTGNSAHGPLECLAGLISAKLPSGLLEPLGLLSLRHLLGRLWERLSPLLFGHIAVVPQ
jgi:hypothetical protein